MMSRMLGHIERVGEQQFSKLALSKRDQSRLPLSNYSRRAPAYLGCIVVIALHLETLTKIH